MKRLTALFLFVCMVLAAMPAIAGNEFFGNMEVVNCKEWVSLRDTPRTSAPRLAKVPLGTVVTQCRQYGSGWIYAQYGEYEGYIQEKYLQPCEGMSMYSAMLVCSLQDGTPLYESIGDLQPIGMIPTDTIVRNCAVMARGRAYVECGGQTGYVDAEDVTPYNELLHFPRQITVKHNVFAEASAAPAPVLLLTETADFSLAEHAFSEYDFTECLPSADDTPKAEFVLHSDTALHHVHLFSSSLSSMDIESGEAVYDLTLEHIQYQLDPEHPLSVIAVIYGDTPNLAVGYEDRTGAYHFAFVEISGEDGSLCLREF